MEGDIFDWKSWLASNDCEAACVSSLKHAPAAQIWTNLIKIGLKLMIRHQEVYTPNPTRRKHAYWIATIVQIKGYYCKLRFDGMGNDASFDFWIHIGKHDVYPIGTELKNLVLIPPKYLIGKVDDWRTYFLDRLPGAQTLPNQFSMFLRNAILGSKYKVGEHLEVLDKYKISQLRVARVSKVIGKRMYLRYLDDFDDGFFCHEQSSLIHSLGWSACVGHKIKTPSNFTSIPESTPSTNASGDDGGLIVEGMRLEAVDPLCPGRICAAKVTKVLEFGYMMIKMDCYDKSVYTSDEEDDWFCYNIKSPYIFPCGFCESNQVPLVPPYGQNPSKFSWSKFLAENNLLAAPIPQIPPLNHGLSVGMKVEMVDVMTPMKIHVATIVQVAGRLLRINFDGWEPEFDQWLDAESPDIFPIGWCELVNHQLDGPKQTGKK